MGHFQKLLDRHGRCCALLVDGCQRDERRCLKRAVQRHFRWCWTGVSGWTDLPHRLPVRGVWREDHVDKRRVQAQVSLWHQVRLPHQGRPSAVGQTQQCSTATGARSRGGPGDRPLRHLAPSAAWCSGRRPACWKCQPKYTCSFQEHTPVSARRRVAA